MINLALKLLLIYFTYVKCMSMTIVDLVMVVVGWTKTLWNCGSIARWIIFSFAKIISTLCLLLTAFINLPIPCFCGLAREPNKLAPAFQRAEPS